MQASKKATRIELLKFSTPPMRAFHISWIAFFICFFAWFAIPPLMAVIREDLKLTKEQIDNTVIAAVAATILGRLVMGWFLDKFGPRLAYTILLISCAVPVMGVGLCNSYQSFLLCRLAIGIVGASFVITQFHTSVMFASNCVGTANATSAGWGNMGGGATQIAMPWILAAVCALGASKSMGWRISMLIPGVAMLIMAVVYYLTTQDTPEGNFTDLRAAGKIPPSKASGSFGEACKDSRVWALFLAYGACFGLEIVFHNVAPLYFKDNYSVSIETAGILVGCFGMLAFFARPLGGIVSDRMGLRFGLRGRAYFLALMLLAEGIALAIFSMSTGLVAAVATMLLFGLFVHMSAGATYALIPFINRKALGSVAGIIGAGGNVGAVATGFFFKIKGLTYSQALLYMGAMVVICAIATLTVRFSTEDETAARTELETALRDRSLEVA